MKTPATPRPVRRAGSPLEDVLLLEEAEENHRLVQDQLHLGLRHLRKERNKCSPSPSKINKCHPPRQSGGKQLFADRQ